jgi:chromate transporter
MSYLILFYTFAKIGLFSFGGGYAMLPFIQLEVVTNHHWITAKEFVDMVALSQTTPGPIAINVATFVGFKIDGILGATVATAGLVCTPFLLMWVITHFYLTFQRNKKVQAALAGIRPSLLGLIAASVIILGKTSIIDWKSGLLFSLIFLLAWLRKQNPVLLILLAGLLGFILY